MADDRTIKITLKQPFPAADRCDRACSNSFMMPERLAKTDPFKAITEIVGSGPFRFLKDEFVAGSSAAWEKFDGYVPRQEPAEWTSGGKVAHFERIEWKIIPDAATASAALQSGEVDWYEQAQTDLVPLLRRNADIVIAPSNPQGYIGGMRFNHLHPPFNDVRLRRAVLTAVNQEDYMRAIMGDDHSAWRICRSQYPVRHDLWHRGRPAGAEGRSGSREEDDQGGRLQRPEGGDHQPDRLRHDRTAGRHHLRHVQEDRHQRGVAGDRLGLGGAAPRHQGAGGEGRLVDLPHLVHRRLHPQSGRHRAVPRRRAPRAGSAGTTIRRSSR